MSGDPRQGLAWTVGYLGGLLDAPDEVDGEYWAGVQAAGTWGGTTWHERNRGHSGDDRRGWRHLSGWERREIRRRRHTTTATNAEIARDFGVSPRTVSRICREQEGD